MREGRHRVTARRGSCDAAFVSERRTYTGPMILSLASGLPVPVFAAAVTQGLSGSSHALAVWALSGMAAAGYGVALAFNRRAAPSANHAMLVAWTAHALALAYDIFGTGQGARFGFAPAMSATVWLVIAAHALEQRTLVLLDARWALSLAGLLVVLMAALYPGELRAAESPWAPLHWLLGIVSYGLFGAAVMHAWLLGRAETRMRQPQSGEATQRAVGTGGGLPLMMLERLTFRFVDAGFVALTLTLLLGGWFAVQASVGWRWDHKTVFSLAGWLTFALLVVGRHAYGWRGAQATRWVYAGAVLLLLAYVGSRFVLEVMLERAA